VSGFVQGNGQNHGQCPDGHGGDQLLHALTASENERL
jgi:hypothetical protein